MIKLRESIIENPTVKKFYNNYEKITNKVNFPSKFTKINLLVFLIMLSFIFLLSVQSRFDQLSFWNQNKEAFYTSDGVPMMTTLDAYKFIRHAKENRDGTFDTSQLDTKIFYPDNSPFPDPLPLLSYMLDKISSIAGSDYYTTALYMIPFMSSLFIIPLGIYFFLIGYPIIGLLAGFITTYAPVFYNRTFMGRFDTDGLNLFFLFTASIFLLLISKSKKPITIYINSALLGLTIFLFYRFYHHGTFNIIFLVLTFVSLYIANAKWKDILIALLIYILISSPIYLYTAIHQTLHALNVYIFGVKTDSLATIFPNVYETISEAKKENITYVFASILRSPVIGIIGLIGIILFALFNIKKSIPLLPAAMLGSMAFISSGRFAMYLAPAIGAGLGYIIYILTKYIYSGKLKDSLINTDKKIKKTYDTLTTYTPYVLFVLLIFLIIIFKFNSYGNKNYGPSIDPVTYEIFQEMKNELPSNSAIYTWWDYGLAIADATGFPVFHSGMTQETPKTWAIAKSLVERQTNLYNISSYLDTYGIKEFYKIGNIDKKIEEIEKDKFIKNKKEEIGNLKYNAFKNIENQIETYDKGPKNDALYLLLTGDMVDKFGAFDFLANNTHDGLYSFNCSPIKGETLKLKCSTYNFQIAVDIENGKLLFSENNIENINKLNLTQKGHIVEGKLFDQNARFNVVLDLTPEVGKLYLMTNRVYNSAFVQLFMFNNYDDKLFKEVINNYPYGKVFHILKKEK